MLEVLKLMEEGESLVCGIPGGWWIGDEQTSGKVGYGLLRMCLISEETMGSSEAIYYRINETGRLALKDPAAAEKYVMDIIYKQAYGKR